jgi:TPR repeat protein
MYRQGDGYGVVQDYAESVRWLELAAAEGNICAQRRLGYSYFFGEGVVQDYVKAHMWYNVAAAKGISGAATVRDDKIAKLMTAEQIAEAQKRASACVDSYY